MKKIVSLILITLFVFSLVACNGDSNGIVEEANDCANSPEESVITMLNALAEYNPEKLKSVTLYYNPDIFNDETSLEGADKVKIGKELENNYESFSSNAEDEEARELVLDYLSTDTKDNSIYDKIKKDLEYYGLTGAIDDYAKIYAEYRIADSKLYEEIFYSVQINDNWYVIKYR